MSITIRFPNVNDQAEFLAAMQASKDLHLPWVEAPLTKEAFFSYLKKYEADNNISYLVICDERIAGVININQIIRGGFQNAFLGYYVVKGFSGKGIMTEGLRQVVSAAFKEHGLHRLEANIQPENVASIKLVQRCGFRNEGFSPNYLKIMGEWRDHERWATTKEDWKEGD
jgi:RimJ/RimL family protein N-acetyltransferase